MNSRIPLAGVLVIGMASAASATTGEVQKDRPVSSTRTSPVQFDRYQLPAGAALLLRLVTPLDSSSTSVGDQVEATLWSPVIQDGVELIPEGSTVIGNVVSVVRANKRTPIASITFEFSVVEHADTRSRATLTTRRILVQAPAGPVAPRGRGKTRPKPAEATMAAHARFVAVTIDPLLVRIPR